MLGGTDPLRSGGAPSPFDFRRTIALLRQAGWLAVTAMIVTGWLVTAFWSPAVRLAALQAEPFLALGLPLFAVLGGILRSWIQPSLRIDTADGRRPSWIFLRAASLPATLILFTIPVIAGSLAQARHHTFTYSDLFLLPWSDASTYYAGSQAVLAGGTLLPWCTRRPINTLMLAARLALTGNDFLSAMLLECLALGTVVWIFSAVVARANGEWARLFITGSLFAVGRQWAATTLSESLGLIWGTIAAGLLWEAIYRGRRAALALGLFSLVVGLNCRAGAFLSLPLIVFWGGTAMGCSKSNRRNRVELPKNRRFTAELLPAALRLPGFVSRAEAFDWRNVTALALAALCGFLLQMACLAVYADKFDLGHGNLAHIFYNMSKGKPGWTEIYADYPDCRDLPETEQNRFIYDKAKLRFNENPWLLVAGYFRGFAEMALEILEFIVFVFFLPSERWGLLGVGLLTACFIRAGWSHWRCPPISLVLYNLLGVFLSLPVLIASGARTLAVSYPLIALIVVVAFDRTAIKSRDWSSSDGAQTDGGNALWRALAVAAAILTVLPLIGPLVVLAGRQYQAPVAADRTTSPDTSLVLVGPGTAHLDILADRELQATFAPRVRRTDFERRLERWGPKAECGLMPESVSGSSAIMVLADLTPGRLQQLGWVVGPADMVRHDWGWWKISVRQQTGGYSVITRAEPLVTENFGGFR
ncbi:MAG TPA: hypothetical protein VHC22_21640 [Pirellulales bacterium]|nr:hypothetical protein [Pirellulales bacterium]